MADNRLFAFYHSDTPGIVQRSFESGRWGKPTVIAPDMQDNFTVSTDSQGVLYLFAQDAAGDVHLYRLRQGEWKSRVILKNPGDRQTRLNIYPMVSDEGMSIIYNHASGTDSGTLMLRSMDERGKWSAPASIDSYTSGVMPFSVQTITPNHAILFYARKSAEPTIGYVEVSPERTTAFNTIHTTNHRITDTSFLVTNDSLHSLFVVKGMFSSQVIYRKKSSDNFSAPVVLAEGAQMSNCLLMYTSGRLTAYFMAGGNLIHSSSSDHGETFSAAARYTNKFCAVPAKSTYISQIPMDKDAYFARQLYVDRNNAADIQLMSDVYEDFYPLHQAAAAHQTEAASPPESLSDEISLYRDKLEIARLQLTEKDRRMARQAQAAEERETRLSARISELEAEMKNLKSAQEDANKAQRKYPLMIV